VGKDLSRDLESLAAAEPDRATPPRLLKAGLAARGEVVKHIDSLERKIGPPQQMDIESASQFHWTAVKGLGNTVTKFGRAQRYVAALFPAQSEKINADFNRLSRLLLQLEEEIGKKRKEREEIYFCRELADRIRQETDQMADLSAGMARDEASLSELKESESRLEADLKRLESSEPGRRSRELEKTLGKNHEELEKVEAEMADLVAPLSKALTRIVKQGSSDRLSLQYREMLEHLSKNPLEALDKDVSGPLQELRENIATLGLKDRKKEKTLEHLDSLIQGHTLQKLKSRHDEIESLTTELKMQLEESSREMVRLKNDLGWCRQEIRRLETEIARNRQSASLLEERFSQDGAELKDRLERIAGHPVTIDLRPETGPA